MERSRLRVEQATLRVHPCGVVRPRWVTNNFGDPVRRAEGRCCPGSMGDPVTPKALIRSDACGLLELACAYDDSPSRGRLRAPGPRHAAPALTPRPPRPRRTGTPRDQCPDHPRAHSAESIPLPAIAAMTPTEFELTVAALLHHDGFEVVRERGGSGDLGADVIALSPAGKRFVFQCKHGSGSRRLARVDSPDIQRLNGTARPVHCADVVVMVTNGTVTGPALAFARSQHIHCLDRDRLEQWARWGSPCWNCCRISARPDCRRPDRPPGSRSPASCLAAWGLRPPRGASRIYGPTMSQRTRQASRSPEYRYTTEMPRPPVAAGVTSTA
ncbi:restriction endonuclease [Kitasatospora sp. NPDC098663]|uniref:restriction endonuclease n=1 Tax=Kitasatospora sp. NPDC098663 TaxID=3364096 RepID=UPI00381EA14E